MGCKVRSCRRLAKRSGWLDGRAFAITRAKPALSQAVGVQPGLESGIWRDWGVPDTVAERQISDSFLTFDATHCENECNSARDIMHPYDARKDLLSAFAVAVEGWKVELGRMPVMDRNACLPGSPKWCPDSSNYIWLLMPIPSHVSWSFSSKRAPCCLTDWLTRGLPRMPLGITQGAVYVNPSQLN